MGLKEKCASIKKIVSGKVGKVSMGVGTVAFTGVATFAEETSGTGLSASDITSLAGTITSQVDKSIVFAAIGAIVGAGLSIYLIWQFGGKIARAVSDAVTGKKFHV